LVAHPPRSRLEGQLTGLLRDEWSDPTLLIEDLHQLTGGASRETWSFDAVGASGRVALILRRDPPGTKRRGSILAEASALVAAAAVGVPEPRLFLHGGTTESLDAPFMVMERVEGETLARRILREPEYAAARQVLAHQCGEILARIHRIPREQIQDLDEPDPIASITDSLEALYEPRPVLELGLRWLLTHRPAGGCPATVVHGDFRNGNLIVGSDGVRAVLDWENVHLGNPAEDLGWICVKAWRFGGTPPVGGFGTYQQLLDGYAAGGGQPIDLETVKWWETLGTVRWGLGCIAQAQRHLDGSVRSVELAAIGRRACEQEWDLLKLIR
jgi:aminoglycoside phosphotransferase (APT) family kinase protein